jgi:hypothetical protein
VVVWVVTLTVSRESEADGHGPGRRRGKKRGTEWSRWGRRRLESSDVIRGSERAAVVVL